MKVVQIETDQGEIYFTDILPVDAVLQRWQDLGYKIQLCEISEKDFRARARRPQSRRFLALSFKRGKDFQPIRSAKRALSSEKSADSSKSDVNLKPSSEGQSENYRPASFATGPGFSLNGPASG